ncbi:MAG TPA: ribonuclease HII [Candidatus Limnocylindria bacterium]|nr:ribonuclease HII [Candidatus Limnocylindria bacterium]
MGRAEQIDAAWAHDRALWDMGLVISGMDEAGRGPLAGCVTAACVVMPPDTRIPLVFDSKQVSEPRREALYGQIVRCALFVGVGRAEPEEIDRVNILEATRLAMRRAAAGAPCGVFLIDAVTGLRLPGEERAIIRGDSVSYSIAAASIVAKVTRDREMRALDGRYPAYGFLRNKGYGTPEHLAALRQHGPCPLHRATFIGGLCG